MAKARGAQRRNVVRANRVRKPQPAALTGPAARSEKPNEGQTAVTRILDQTVPEFAAALARVLADTIKAHPEVLCRANGAARSHESATPAASDDHGPDAELCERVDPKGTSMAVGPGSGTFLLAVSVPDCDPIVELLLVVARDSWREFFGDLRALVQRWAQRYAAAVQSGDVD